MKPQDLIDLLDLLDERELDRVFYPVDQEHSLRPSEILSGVYIHAKHVLHPDYRPTPQYPYQPTRELLGGWIRTQDDIDAEAVVHSPPSPFTRPCRVDFGQAYDDGLSRACKPWLRYAWGCFSLVL